MTNEEHAVVRALRQVLRELGEVLPEPKYCIVRGEDIDGLDHRALMGEFQSVSTMVYREYCAEFGPLVSWRAPKSEWPNGRIIVSDLDNDLEAWEGSTGPREEWESFETTALHEASLGYKRECGWDFTPGEGGVWLSYCAPTESWGSENEGEHSYFGNLAGFLILYDRDKDGTPESLAHIWTARTWRRKGVATKLLEAARERFTITRIEWPATEDGLPFLRARAGDLIDGGAS
jgi:GNAT superfamily N-acetyltransferase